MIHVVPTNDEKEHTLDTNCVCGVQIHEGEEDIVVAHTSFDNRELLEEQHIKKLSDNKDWTVIEV